MIFYLSRALLFVFCLFLPLYLGKKHKISSVNRVGCFIFASVVMLTSMMFPIENVLIKFKSVESAYKYSCMGNLTEFIEGKESCMVFSDTELKLLPKNGDTYGIETLFSNRNILNKMSNRLSFNVYRYKKTNDYYITAFGSPEDIEKFSISDSCGSNFKKLTAINGTSNTVYYGAYICNYDSDYVVTVNGTEIPLA